MKCFYHPLVDAVGTCKHCSRGLCVDCAAEREGGLACRNKHEAIVDAVSTLIERNVRVKGHPVSIRGMAALVYWGGAIIFLYVLTRANDVTGRLLVGVLAAMLFVSAILQTRLLLASLIKKKH